MIFQSAAASTFGVLHFDKSSNMAKNEEKPCSTCLQAIFPWYTANTLNPGFGYPIISITIDLHFNFQVLRHRQALARFARRRARKTKQKWALKYDQLYFNGRVFVFNEKSRQVEAKTV